MKKIVWDASMNEPKPESQDLIDDFEPSGEFFADYISYSRLLKVLPCPSLCGVGGKFAITSTTQEAKDQAEKAIIDLVRQKQKKARTAVTVKKKKPPTQNQSPNNQQQIPITLQPAPNTADTIKVRIVGHVIDAGTLKAMALALNASNSTSICFSFERAPFVKSDFVFQFMAILTANPNVSSLSIEGIQLPNPTAQLFEPLFTLSSRLTRLSLRGCSIGDDLALRDSIQDLIKKGLTLRELDLSATGIGDGTVSAIAFALRKNTTLLQLSLSRNKIGNNGALELAAAIGRYSLAYEERLSRKREIAELEQKRAELLNLKASRQTTRQKVAEQSTQQNQATATATPIGSAMPPPQSSSPSLVGAANNSSSPQLSIKARKRQEQQLLQEIEQKIALISPVEEHAEQWIVKGNRTLMSLWISGNNAIDINGKNALLSAQKENSTLTKLFL